MDILAYLLEYRVLICKNCQSAILLTAIEKHLRTFYLHAYPALASNSSIRKFTNEVLLGIITGPLLDPFQEAIIVPSEECGPLPHLTIHRGFGCAYCPLVSKYTSKLRQHYNAAYAVVRRRRSGLKNSGGRTIRARLEDEHFGSQASPWLERTRWLHYLQGVDFHQAVHLIRLPERDEPILCEILLSVDRLIENSHASVCEDRINFFAQKCISSFLPQRKAYSRPLIVKLQKKTYQRYKDSWKRLICFACRTLEPSQPVRLRHQLTTRQTALLDELIAAGAEWTAIQDLQGRESAGMSDPQRVDDSCLDFCIALLDHQLKGDIFESVVLGFLAVLGVDAANSTFHQATNYTSKLSGFMKIAQMLVLQKAVREVEKGRSDNALDPLDDMRQQFMTVDNCTPFSWAISLRAFGKTIQDSVTSTGYIRWSDDGQTVFYKDVELHLSAFRAFVASQMKRAQEQLANLFLLSGEDRREDIIPPISLYRLRDDPTVTKSGWNFLHDPRNRDIAPIKEGWLLRRLLETDRLREQFVFRNRFGEVEWDKPAVRKYSRQVAAFLDTFLLLVHITSGQPARGTEIIGLLHTNTTLHRNVFMEEGLISVVASYHKGYSCSGSTKIIHRYLPKELSELCVYYLWIVCPFVKELGLLAPHSMHPVSSYLWPAAEGCCSSQRLSAVLKRETGTLFTAPLTTATYRHIAIALSRRYIHEGGFKRDYDVENISDEQAAHTSGTAGRLYARGLEEAPGHVEARRAEFRAVSRRWHAFLGFASPAPASHKRALADRDPNTRESKRIRLEKPADNGNDLEAIDRWDF